MQKRLSTPKQILLSQSDLPSQLIYNCNLILIVIIVLGIGLQLIQSLHGFPNLRLPTFF